MTQEQSALLMPDDWDANLYDEKHAFVFEYGRDLIKLLKPQAGERILDLGCGTGHLTKVIAASGAQVIGLDSSQTMIEAARAQYPGIEFIQADARSFSWPCNFDAVFSNAVLHWILDAESVVRSIATALRRGGRFVAEFGGRGNIAQIEQALRAALNEHGYGHEPAWWYYPTLSAYATLLEAHELEVRLAMLYDRPTKLAGGAAGLRTWLEMFTRKVLSQLNEAQQAQVLTRVEQQLRPTLFRDGDWYADYRRLRIVAVKQ